jgi:hypothetical protein
LEAQGVAKDSNKLRVLARRKQELDHAIAHGLSSDALHKRAEKLRTAAVAVLKKYRNAIASSESFQMRWAELTVDEIIRLSVKWGSQPTLRNICLRRPGLDDVVSDLHTQQRPAEPGAAADRGNGIGLPEL